MIPGILLLLLLAPAAVAAPIQLRCEGPEETETDSGRIIDDKVSHSVMLDKARGTISVGKITAAYHLSDPPTMYKADDAVAARAEDRERTYIIALHRHKLELYFSREADRRTWVTFVGSCTASNPID